MFFKVYQRVVAVVIDLTAPGKSFFSFSTHLTVGKRLLLCKALPCERSRVSVGDNGLNSFVDAKSLNAPLHTSTQGMQ